MAVFKRKRKVKQSNGRTVVKTSSKYYVRYRDVDGIQRTVPGYTDREATKQLEARLKKEAALAKEGVVDRYKEHRKKALKQHLDEFKDNQLNRGVTEKQAKQVFNRCKAVIDACKFVFIGDVSASKVEWYLANRRKEGLSIRTSNFYLGALKQFFYWLCADGRTDESPVAYLKGQNPKLDIRHPRRALTLDEIERLLIATMNGERHHLMEPFERHNLYWLDATEGFRATESASLIWDDFNLDTDEPTVRCPASYTKNRKEAYLPLRKDVAAEFKRWRDESGFQSHEKVFPTFNPKKGAEMLRKDLEVAGIEYQDSAGRYADFHALRHTSITHVGKSGATMSEHQNLARHSKPELTLGVYTHLSMSDERRALERVPSFVKPKKSNKNESVQVCTGTDNQPVNVSQPLSPKWTPFLTPSADSDKNSLAADGTVTGNRVQGEAIQNSQEIKELCTDIPQLSADDRGEKGKAAAGFEPANNGFANRRLRPLGYAAEKTGW
jgi:integrase